MVGGLRLWGAKKRSDRGKVHGRCLLFQGSQESWKIQVHCTWVLTGADSGSLGWSQSAGAGGEGSRDDGADSWRSFCREEQSSRPVAWLVLLPSFFHLQIYVIRCYYKNYCVLAECESCVFNRGSPRSSALCIIYEGRTVNC